MAKTHKDVVRFLEDRNDAEPAMVFSMPGILRILGMIDDTKTGAPDLYIEPNFPIAMGIVSFTICMDDGGMGWVQEVPGRAVIHKPNITSSPKVKI